MLLLIPAAKIKCFFVKKMLCIELAIASTIETVCTDVLSDSAYRQRQLSRCSQPSLGIGHFWLGPMPSANAAGKCLSWCQDSICWREKLFDLFFWQLQQKCSTNTYSCGNFLVEISGCLRRAGAKLPGNQHDRGDSALLWVVKIFPGMILGQEKV